VSDKPNKPEKLPVQYRYFELDRAALNKDTRTIALTFSSDTPVRRWFGNEVLDHSKKTVRMERMNNGAPLLANHDADQHIGVVESAGIKDGKGAAEVRFGNSPLAQQKFQDVQDGILRNVSVGYIVHRYQITETDDKSPDEYRAIDWEPVEVSLVAVPADPTVGVGRELREFPVAVEYEAKQIPAAVAAIPIQENRSMATTVVTPNVEVNAVREKLINDEVSRVRNISALGAQYREYIKPERVAKWIADETSESDVRKQIGDDLIARFAPVNGAAAEAVDMSAKEKKEYSVVRAMREFISRGNCMELEISAQIGKNLKREPSHGGFFLPKSIPGYSLTKEERDAIITGQRAPLTNLSGAVGGFTVETDVQPLIAILRNKIVARRLGANMLTGLRDPLLFPKQITAGAGFWMAENSGADVTEQDMTFGSFTLSPKTVMALQKYSRQLLAQSSVDIEALVRNDIAAQIAIAIDLAVINGSGAANQPLGILGQAGLDVVAEGTNGAQPTYASIVQMETDVATANSDIGSLAYATTPGIRGRLKQTLPLANTVGLPVWTADKRLDGGLQQGECNGYPAIASNQIPANLTKGTSVGICHAIIFGDWSSVLIGEWNALEILPDPYTLGAQAMVRVFAWDLCDTNLRYVSAFSVVKDALP
jgi:HK97 family phage major capsid protein/HK97 family phage prohead protease